MLWMSLALAHTGPALELERLSEQVEVSGDVHLERARSLSELGLDGQALAELDRAAALGHDDPLLRAALTQDASVLGDLDTFDAWVLRGRLAEGDVARDFYDRALAIEVTVEVALLRGQAARDPRDAALGYERAIDALGPARTLELAVIHAWIAAGEADRALAWVDAAHARSASPDLLLIRYGLTDDPADRLAAVSLAEQRYERNPTPLRRAEVDRARAVR